MLQADGGTRCASITGGYVALVMALRQLERAGVIKDYTSVLKHQIAAVSCGIFQGEAVLDLDYAEDSNAQADTNFIMTADGKIVEVQGTAEDGPFDQSQLSDMMALATQGAADLPQAQNKALMAAAMKDMGWAHDSTQANGTQNCLATHNPGKVVEIKALLEPFGTDVVLRLATSSLPEPLEDAPDFIGNAKIKALSKARPPAGCQRWPTDSGCASTHWAVSPAFIQRWAGPNKDFNIAMTRVAGNLGRS